MKLKKTLAVFLTLCMLVSTLGVAALAAPAAQTESVAYVDENGEEANVEATVLSGGGLYGAEGETGWYVLKGEADVSDPISFHDAVVNVILADDADWTVHSSTLCALNLFGGDLNVYAQAAGTGRLETTQRFGSNYGSVGIYGGNITATDGLFSDPVSGNSVTIGGGVINAGAATLMDLVMSGGEVRLTGTFISGDVTITGGTLTCDAQYNGLQAPDGAVAISGGTVNVSGGQNGIYAKTLSITGGDVTATGSGTMGIMVKESAVLNGGKIDVTGRIFSVYSNEGVSVVFGCPTHTDFITLHTKLNPEGGFSVVEGQTLTDGENSYTGTLTADEITALTGKTLTKPVSYTPVEAKAPTADENGNIAHYEGSDGKLYVKNGDNYVETTEQAVLVPYFQFTSDGEQLSGYNGLDAEIVLPETIPDNYPDEALRGKSYGIVRDWAFSNHSVITKVTMGDNIYHIGQGAFNNCENLEELYMGERVEMIQPAAFDGCVNLKKVYCTSPVTYDPSVGHYNWADLEDTDALKVWCVKGSILDDADVYDNVYYIYLPLIEEKPATCTEDGHIAYYKGAQGDNALYFNADGEVVSAEDLVIPAGHKLGAWVDAVPADCGNDGTIGHYQCSVCGLYFDADKNPLESIVVSATGAHSYDETWTFFSADQHVRYCTVCGKAPEYEAHNVIIKGAGDATCGDEGYTGDKFCAVCGQRLSEGAIIPPTGNHTITTVNAKEATENENGYTGDEVCTVCGKTIKAGEIIPATGSTTPDEPTDEDGDCPYCGKHHAKKWVLIVHLVLWFLRNAFRFIKK